MSAVPFRLQPCENPTEASLDALTFGDPSLYEKLLTLNRVEILAENPRVRAGTIWYRVDREFCFVEAVAIRTGLYPLVYKVLPEMMAAQLGFSYVGRYFNMTYGYSTRSLVWDEKAISENGARSYASVYPGMIPIVKLTAIIAGSTRTPVLVRHDQNSAGAAADAILLGDANLANKLAEVARLEVVTGSAGNRAGTIWYFRNGNYCFVIASAFRPEAPAEIVRLAPLLVAQFFGYSYVGNYTAIPADLKDKALCWDRYTGTPIPELSPLSGRLQGVQDFIVTFSDTVPLNPNPDSDPWPQVICDNPEDHRWASGWSWDGCHWSEVYPSGPNYYWQPNFDGLGGSWGYNNPPMCDNPEDHRWASGWSWDGCHWSQVYPSGSNYYWQPNFDGLGGSWGYNNPPPPMCDNPEDHRWASGWNWDGCHWSQVSPSGSNNYWQPNGDGLGGSWGYNPNSDPNTYRYQSGWNWDGSQWSNSPMPPYGSNWSWQSNGDGLGGYWFDNSNYGN